MYVGKKITISDINFLASEHFVSFTEQVDENTTGVITDSLGHKVVPAGTVFPSNDSKAKGITIHEVNVSNGPQPVGVIVEGWLLSQRLPVLPTDEAMKSMNSIKWRDIQTNDKPSEPDTVK